MNSTVLAKLRKQAQNSYLTDSCVIERPYQTEGELMQPVDSWIVIGSGVKCRVIKIGQQKQTGTAEKVGDLQAMEDTYRIALPHDVDIAADDRIWVNGLAYQVMALETDLSDTFFVHAVAMRHRGLDPV